MNLIILSLIVFAITLIITKSKIMANKREFVKQRYLASKVNGNKPLLIHQWWESMWFCPMCAGFWWAALLCLFYHVNGYIVDVLVIFALNWLIHCVENLLFFAGKYSEKISEKGVDEQNNAV